MPLVRRIVGGYLARLPPNVERDDLMCAGACGLVDALQRNPDRRSASFLRYANFRVRGAIVDELRVVDWLSRSDRKRLRRVQDSGWTWISSVIPLEDLSKAALGRLVDERTPSPLEAAELSHQRDTILAAMDRLLERDRVILTLFYFEGALLKDIAERLGVSRPRATQLHLRAIARLRSTLSSHFAGELELGGLQS
jgi:RNA polymerase sigma factor FliA